MYNTLLLEPRSGRDLDATYTEVSYRPCCIVAIHVQEDIVGIYCASVSSQEISECISEVHAYAHAAY